MTVFEDIGLPHPPPPSVNITNNCADIIIEEQNPQSAFDYYQHGGNQQGRTNTLSSTRPKMGVSTEI
jgi:hypothetical protein